MSDSRNTACIEITNSSVKFASGYMTDGKPVILNCVKLPLNPECRNKQHLVPEAVGKVIRTLKDMDDPMGNRLLDTDTVSVILPAINFIAYERSTRAGTAEQDGTVTQRDILSLISTLKKTSRPTDSSIQIVDVVPQYYTTCSKGGTPTASLTPPIGAVSETVDLKAFLHALPTSLVLEHKNSVDAASLKIERTTLAPYCAAQYLKGDPTIPQHYIYVDMGATVTSVTLVGKGMPYANMAFSLGGYNLTLAIADSLGLSEAEAEKIKVERGYDERVTEYKLSVAIAKAKDGREYPRSQSDLNVAITNYFTQFNDLLNISIGKICEKQQNPELAKLPIVFGGDASKLHGLTKLIKTKSQKLIVYVPDVMGARDPGLINVLGMIVVRADMNNSLQDEFRGVSTLTRQ